jgi:hypothetical protein
MFSPVGAPRLWVERSTDAPVGALEVDVRPPGLHFGMLGASRGAGGLRSSARKNGVVASRDRVEDLLADVEVLLQELRRQMREPVVQRDVLIDVAFEKLE